MYAVLILFIGGIFFKIHNNWADGKLHSLQKNNWLSDIVKYNAHLVIRLSLPIILILHFLALIKILLNAFTNDS